MNKGTCSLNYMYMLSSLKDMVIITDCISMAILIILDMTQNPKWKHQTYAII